MVTNKKSFTLEEACKYIESQISLLFNITVSKKIKLVIRSFALGYGKSLKVGNKLTKNTETDYYAIPLNYLLDMIKEFLTHYEDNIDGVNNIEKEKFDNDSK